MIMHHIILCTPCIAFILVSHTCIFVIDHTEQGHGEEPTQVKGVNTEQYQGKPRCIKPPSLNSFYIYILIMILKCALGYMS
jgi:hypothetical protein